MAAALDDARVWRVQLDTYEREVERYGGDTAMLASEDVFWRDSDAVLAILQRSPGDAGMDARWRLCVRGMDWLLADFGFDLEARGRMAHAQRDRLAAEVRADKQLEVALGDRFRRERRSLEALFDPAQEAGHPLQHGLAALRHRSEALAPTMRALRDHAASGSMASLESLAFSHLHMHANRMLRSSHLPQELVCYDFLDRLYEAQRARARRGMARGAAGDHDVAGID